MNKRVSPHHSGNALPTGDIRPLAEIEIGPSKHEQFLDQNYKKVALIVVVAALLVSGYIVWLVLGEEKKSDAGSALVNVEYSENGDRAAQFGQVANDFLGTKSATTAEFLKAEAYWVQGQEEEGNKAMEDFIMKAPTQEWKALAATTLGCRYMNKGKLEDAIRCFDLVAGTGSALYAPVALMSLGDIARQQRDADKAASYYDQVLQQYPASMFARVNDLNPGVLARKELLSVKAPQPVRTSAPAPAATDVPATSLQLPGTPAS